MNALVERIRKHRQFLLYALVGAANTLVTMGVLYVTRELAGWSGWLCYPLAYGAGAANGYFWSTRSVFRVRGTAGNLTRFLLVNVATLGVNQGLMWLLADHWGVYSLLAQALVTPFTFIANYSLNKLWTFAQPGGARPES